MKIITAMPGTPVEIGRTGENHAIKVLFQNIHHHLDYITTERE